jgi:hypothetical protein
MRKLLFVTVIGALLFVVSCKKDTQRVVSNPTCSIEGRWIDPLGNTLYEFKDSLKYTFYQTTPGGQFGTIADSNFIPGQQKWWMEGDSLVRKFGSSSYLKSLVEFDCNCNRMKLTSNCVTGICSISYWKEGFDTTTCQ